MNIANYVRRRTSEMNDKQKEKVSDEENFDEEELDELPEGEESEESSVNEDDEELTPIQLKQMISDLEGKIEKLSEEFKELSK
jgi:TolA-binding protein